MLMRMWMKLLSCLRKGDKLNEWFQSFAYLLLWPCSRNDVMRWKYTRKAFSWINPVITFHLW
jgi:hypothetical protein